MSDRFASRRTFLRRLFAGAGAIAVAGPAVLEQLDRLEPSTRTHVDMGRTYAVEQVENSEIYAATLDVGELLSRWQIGMGMAAYAFYRNGLFSAALGGGATPAGAAP